MSVLDKLRCMQNRRDQAPNQELAEELVLKKDIKGIQEIAENLWNKDRNIQSDCIEVLHWIGDTDPDLISGYVKDFLRLLSNKSNRLVWGSMIALATIADQRPQDIFDHLDLIIEVIENGSVITIDNGIKTLAAVASVGDEYNREIFPYLIVHLGSCRPKDVPQHAESVMRAVNAENQAQYIDVLNERFDTLSSSQQKRVKKILKTLEGKG